MNILTFHSRSAESRDDAQTPPEVLQCTVALGPIALDPCTASNNPVGARRWIALPDDGLTADWRELSEGGLTFVNPPYGRALEAWARKIVHEAERGCEIVALTPSRSETKWFRMLWLRARAVCLWEGRLRFIDPETGLPYVGKPGSKNEGKPQSAGFPSLVSYFGPHPRLFASAFRDAGIVEVLR